MKYATKDQRRNVKVISPFVRLRMEIGTRLLILMVLGYRNRNSERIGWASTLKSEVVGGIFN